MVRNLLKKIRTKIIDFNFPAEKEIREERECLREYLKQNRIWLKRVGDPTQDIGNALELMRNYKMFLSIGTHYAQCQCTIEKDNFMFPVRDGIKSSDVGSFKEDGEINSIYAFHSDVCLAICKCCMFAHKGGVIAPTEECID